MKKKLKLSKSSTLGYILILIGLLTLTIPMIRKTYSNYSAKVEMENFEKEQKTRDSKEVKEETKKAEEYNEIIRNSDITVVDPFTAQDYKNRYEMFKNSNIPFAYLSIPKLDKHLPIYLDATLEHISIGVAQVDGTSIPIGGKNTRSVIAGHRDRRGDTMFLYIDELEKGDYIYIERAQSTMRYAVSDKEVIDPYDRDKLLPRKDVDMITLMTCSPFLPPRPNRLLVNCIRDEEVAKEVKEENNPSVPIIKEDKINTPPITKTDNLVQISTIMTLLLSIIGSIAFVLVLIRFINRIRATINK